MNKIKDFFKALWRAIVGPSPDPVKPAPVPDDPPVPPVVPPVPPAEG